jgi:hypothetical protein
MENIDGAVVCAGSESYQAGRDAAAGGQREGVGGAAYYATSI